MLRSMFSAISGMKAHQTKLDVTGNNIANVNTVGFKSSTTVFQDTLSQVVRNGGAAGEEIGGTNPAQVGLGVKVAGISTNFSQGSSQSTGRSEDFMIQGDGFFVTRAGNENLYTRAGSMSFDSLGRLVTPDGSFLQGWNAVNGVVDANGTIGNLTVPFGQIVAPKQTTAGVLSGNLPADAPFTPAGVTKIIRPVLMYDGQGKPIQMAYEFEKTAANTWTVKLQNVPPITAPPTAPVVLGTTTLNFNATTGALTTPSPAVTAAMTPPAATFPGWTGPVTVDLAGLVQYGSKSSVESKSQDGYASGTLQSFSLGDDGTLTGVFSNNERQALGKVALATFDNPNGLQKAGNSSFRIGNNSGLANVGEAGTGSRGTMAAGMLEMSNVDLAEEFTGLIVAQRGFQANSRVITSSDEILQELVRLGR